MRRLLVACSLTVLMLAACSSDGDSSDPGSVPLRTTADGGTVPAVTTIAPTTTFILDCAQMPSVADISAAVGVPMGDGQVVGAGTCQYLGLNDQSKSITLALFTDPGDQAAFTDLQASLGAATPYTDPALAGAVVGPDATLYVTANGAIYTVNTQVTGGGAAEQVPLSAAVLLKWLQL